MTELNANTDRPQTQKERWMRYGANVALTTIAVILLAVVLIALAQRQHKRIDTTLNKEYSLKPQTVNIIKDLKDPIRLVSLYSHSETNNKDETDYAGTVADLLDEYKSTGRNIEVETIDPVTNPTKVDDLISDVTSKYGGEVKKYRDFCENADKYFEPVRQFAKDELAKLNALQIDRMKEDSVNQTLGEVSDTLLDEPGRLDKVSKLIDAQRKQKVPDYKGAADTIQSEMDRASSIAATVSAKYMELAGTAMSPEQKQYMAQAVPRFDLLKKQADAVSEEYKKLGELKLDELRQKLHERNAVLVMGPTDMRSLSFDQVWPRDTDKRSLQNQPDDVPRRRFAGEKQISSAILSLTMAKKPKVVFLRPGGPPLTTPGFPPFQQGGPLSAAADRLREYNFDVLEKDMSGQYAMQAQMQGQPAPPEPTDAEIKDAVWVVLSFPNPPQQQQQMPPPPLAPKVAEHLKQGGAALCLFLPQSDNLSGALSDWGVDARTDLLAVHKPVQTSSTSNDFIEEAKKNPLIFVTNQYGDNIITKPLNSLDSVLIPMVPIVTSNKAGYTSTAILPVPIVGETWGEHDVEGAMNGDNLTFNPQDGDLAGPLFTGSVVQNDKGTRLVAIGSLQFITNQMLNMRDPELAQRGIPAARFPGNGDLFCNSIFWLAHMEPLIAISPSAMDVNRIGEISDGTLKAWRVGLLLVGLPGAVIVCGMLMYFARRN